ncbi:hypothetical protein [Streptomyces lydicus]|uniref:hypothetical protein n=1 Tax=Streptomyces lydicus TaxID=47763 RepID=UPI00370253DA
MNKYGDGSTRIAVTDMDRATTADDYQQARHFVIESALQASRTDATSDQLNARFPNDIDVEIEEWTWTGPAGSRD